MAYVTEKIRKLATSATGAELWRVKTSDGVVTEATYETPNTTFPVIHRPVIETEREKE